MTTSIKARFISGALGLAIAASAIPAFASNGDDDFTSLASTTASYNVSCVQTAVGVREDARIAAQNTYNTSLTTALTVRKNEMVAAWATSTVSARFDALKSAMTKYRATVKTAKQTYASAQSSANTTFITSMKNCGVTSSDLRGETKREKKNSKKMDDDFWKGLGLKLKLGHSEDDN